MNVRKEVEDLVVLGSMPDEKAELDEIASYEAALFKIEKPVSDEEAALLLELFGPDDCYGLAWSLLHLIETAPSGIPLRTEPSADKYWLHLLWARSHPSGAVVSPFPTRRVD